MPAKISIVIPAYNVEKYLDECLKSVCNQTLQEIEIILVDDGSTDKTAEICNRWANRDKRIRLIHQENKGVSDARNLAISLATAPYIAFVDSDDWIEPDMFAQMYAQTQKTNADICVCGVFIEHLHKTKKTDKGKKGIVPKKTAMFRLLYDTRWHSFSCNKLFLRDIWKEVEFPSGKVFEDFAIMHHVFDRARVFAHTGTTLYHYRQQPESIGHTGSVEKSTTFFRFLCDRYQFLQAYSLLNNYEKKQISLRLQKRMLRVFQDVINRTSKEESVLEKEYMQRKIQQYTGSAASTESQIKKQLRKLFFLRLFARLGILD